MLLWHLVLLLFIYGVNCQITRLRLTCDQVRAFVDGHNWKRHQVAQGMVPMQPAASNMKYMTWDDELAEKAARWAENGQFVHNADKTIWSQRWNNLVGENLYTNQLWSTAGIRNVAPNITEAVNSWFNEYKDYMYSPFQVTSGKPIGHYTQMVWAESNRVGCGISQTRGHNNVSTLFVCNYGPAGNYLGKLPYWPGPNRGFLQCARGDCNNRPYGFYCRTLN